MKQGWERKKLGDVATYVNGFAFKPEQWVDSGIPIIRIQNLNNPEAPYNYCNIEIPSKYIVEKGDILISWSASLGVYEWLNDKGYLNQHIFKVVFDKGDISKYYLKYAVSAKLNDMEKQLHGATMKHIVKKDFDNTLIPVPPLPEQEKIVSELDCLSGIIEKKRQQLKELDSLAQSIFYEMFGDPVTNEKGWEVKKLEQLCSIINGFAFPSSAFSECNPIKAVKITNVGVNEFVHDDSSLPNQYNSKEDFKVHTGDIVIALTRTVISTGLKRAIIPKEYNNALVNQRVAAIITDNKVAEKNFIYSFLGTDFVKDYVLSHATALMQPNLSIKDLRELPAIYPPLPLQQTFASKIEAIEKQKELIKQSLSEVETLFNARMQEYFS